MEKLRKFETEEQYLNEKESLEYPQISLTADNEKVWVKSNLCSFNIIYNNNEYQTFYFKKGMTWTDFINSPYNISICDESENTFELSYYFSGEYNCIRNICADYRHTFICYNDNHGNLVGINDLIINGNTYYSMSFPV